MGDVKNIALELGGTTNFLPNNNKPLV